VRRHAALISSGGRVLDWPAGRPPRAAAARSRASRVAVDRDALALAALEGEAGIETLRAISNPRLAVRAAILDAAVVSNYLHRRCSTPARGAAPGRRPYL